LAQIDPFRGWRYVPAQVGDLSDVTCPPYDVIDAGLQTALYERHPCNVVRLELNRQEPLDPDAEEKYRRAAEFLARWQKQGVLAQDDDEALYVCHQVFTWGGQTLTRRGFVGRIRLEPFGAGQVYPHEQTLSGPKADRLKLLAACQMNISPIFGLYPDDENQIQASLERAVHGQTAHEARDHLGVIHRLWPMTNRLVIDQARQAMATRPVFIADGHHRYETALNYRDGLAAQGALAGPNAPANYVMMTFVGMSDPGLVILPTHRLVSGIDGAAPDVLARLLAPCFQVERVGAGRDAAAETWSLIEADGGQGVLGLGTADGHWLLARVVDSSPMGRLAAGQSDDWRGLAVSILHKLVIEHLLQPVHAAEGPSFRYVHQVEEVLQALEQGAATLGCLVPPARIEHVRRIAERLEKMPPKSTYFYPKLQTGLVMNPV